MESLDVLVRFHDLSRAFELRRAIFSLVCQSYRPITIRLLTQRFSGAQIEQLRNDLAPTLEIDGSVRFEMTNYESPEPKDARSALLNMGIRISQGRYLAILDHDDSIFPEAYCELTGELRATGCAIAFGSIAMKDIDVFQDALLVEKRRAAFVGKSLIDLFDDNFCPIHSFVIDREQVAADDLFFDESISKLEDYNLLLRLCAKYESSFQLVGTFVGDYYIKNDGTNTLMFELETPEDRGTEWIRCDTAIQELKDKCVLAAPVQRQLGLIPADPTLTVRKLLKQLKDSDG